LRHSLPVFLYAHAKNGDGSWAVPKVEGGSAMDSG
jgi:hypothetical protein